MDFFSTKYGNFHLMDYICSTYFPLQQNYTFMPAHRTEPFPAQVRIVYEIVLYRHCQDDGTVLIGEATLMLERDERSGLLRSLHVTLLSVFNATGEEVYGPAVKNVALKQRLEAAVVEHYYHPPAKPVVLPRRIVEW